MGHKHIIFILDYYNAYNLPILQNIRFWVFF